MGEKFGRVYIKEFELSTDYSPFVKDSHYLEKIEYDVAYFDMCTSKYHNIEFILQKKLISKEIKFSDLW